MQGKQTKNIKSVKDAEWNSFIRRVEDVMCPDIKGSMRIRSIVSTNFLYSTLFDQKKILPRISCTHQRYCVRNCEQFLVLCKKTINCREYVSAWTQNESSECAFYGGGRSCDENEVKLRIKIEMEKLIECIATLCRWLHVWFMCGALCVASEVMCCKCCISCV